MNLKRYIIVAMLTAMAIILSIVDSMIPIGIPGVKLGLANVIILIMLYDFKVKEALLANVLRITLVGLIRGSIFSPVFFMSLSGGVLSFIVMLIFSKIKVFSPVGVSVLGSVFHCAGQIIVAMIILSTGAVIGYLPFIAILSIVTGILTGLVTKEYLKREFTKNFL